MLAVAESVANFDQNQAIKPGHRQKGQRLFNFQLYNYVDAPIKTRFLRQRNTVEQTSQSKKSSVRFFVRASKGV